MSSQVTLRKIDLSFYGDELRGELHTGEYVDFYDSELLSPFAEEFISAIDEMINISGSALEALRQFAGYDCVHLDEVRARHFLGEIKSRLRSYTAHMLGS